MADTARPTRRYLRDDRVALDAVKARAREDSILGVAPGILLAMFVFSLLIPAEFRVGPIRLTPYTALLIVFIIPLFLHFLRQVAEGTNRLILLDALMIGHMLWIAVSIIENNGLSRIVLIFNLTVSLFGGYMVGRILVRNSTDYAQFFRWFFYGLLFWFPFAMIELVTKRMLISEILAIFADTLPRAGNDPRLGLNRVQAFMEHAITYGLLCGVGVANSYYILRDAQAWRYLRTGFFAFMTFISLSSAPVIALGMQVMLIGWDWLLGVLRHKWILLVVVGTATLLVVQLAAPRGIIGLVIENLAFDPRTGWGRTEILKYGSAEVARHPWLGIGMNDWIRPWYRTPSIDNFWLVTAMRYGLPALIFLGGGILLHLLIILTRVDLDPRLTDLRKGYLIAWIGTIFVLATVHIWGAGPLFIMAYLGAGSIFYTGTELAPPRPAYRRRQALAEIGAEHRQATLEPPPRGGGLRAPTRASGVAAPAARPPAPGATWPARRTAGDRLPGAPAFPAARRAPFPSEKN